nr:AbrB/MazE/SpoVT family DNA-binding domain-containing protein [Mesorhizobium camelthorni]
MFRAGGIGRFRGATKRVTTKGRVTIPKEVRDRLGIGPGSEVEFVEGAGGIVLRKREDPPPSPSQTFEERVASMSGTCDTMGMDGKEYVDWLRGPRDDIDPD